jgi:4,5-DOPA dioxygenase extradiol
MAHHPLEVDSMRLTDSDAESTVTMPALFIGHGNPLNAIDDTEFSRAWLQLDQTLPTPKAILCVSAHWETDGMQVTARPVPCTIQDFLGVPRPLFEWVSPAPQVSRSGALASGRPWHAVNRSA